MIHWNSTSRTLRRSFQEIAETLFILLWQTSINSPLFIRNIQFLVLESQILASALDLFVPLGRFLFCLLLPRLNFLRCGKVSPEGFFKRRNMFNIFNECRLQNALNLISVYQANKG